MPKKVVPIEVKKSETLVSAAQLARIWGVSRAQVSRLVHTGRIKEGVIRVGEQLVFDLTKVKYPESKRSDNKAKRDQAAKAAAMGV